METSTTVAMLSSIDVYRAEAAVRRCSSKQVFLKISQNSQENTCARVSFLDSGTSILQNRELFHNHRALYLLHALHATKFKNFFKLLRLFYACETFLHL